MQLPSPLGASVQLPLPTQPIIPGDYPGIIGMGIPNATIAAGATQFSGYATLFGGTEPGKQLPLPGPKTLRQIVFLTSGAQPAGQNLTITVRKNGVDTGLTLVIPGNAAAGLFLSPVFAVTFALGDTMSLKAVQDAGAAVSATILGWSVN